jgi:integrase/recombinase XerD
LREPTLYKFRLLFRQMKGFAKTEGLVYVSDFNVNSVRQFRQSWPNKNFAARKKLEATRAFFRFCQQSGWIPINPAAVLKPGRTVDPEIIPITKAEFDKILRACETYPDKENRIRLRALVLVMWYTGLRVRDVVTLKKDRIKNGKLFLRTAKTGTDVFCPLPQVVIETLDQIGSENGYYFWSGQSKPKSAVGNYQRALKTLFGLAGVPRVHAHLFRHTFATEMLLAGNSLETVAALLGHTSTRVTERSYSHWIKGRQEKLEEAVKIHGHVWAHWLQSKHKTAENPHKRMGLRWWRRGELNPRPKSATPRSLHAYLSSIGFAFRAQNEQETQPASPMVLAQALRTERLRPAHCMTLLAGPVSKARGSVRLIN